MSNQAILNTQNRISCTITCYSSKKFENSFLAELNNSDLFCFVFFSIRVFFHGHWQLTRQQGKGGDHLIPLYNFHPLTNIRHLFATLHVRWLSHIFNRNACIYQTATRWDLPPYRVTIWLIDDVILSFVCLYVELMLGFVTAIWHEKLVDSNSNRLSSLY